MALQLNRKEEPNLHKEYNGSVVYQMPLLMAEERIPISLAYIIQRRETPVGQLNDWHLNGFWTGDAIANGTEKDAVLINDSQLLRAINPESSLYNGALVLSAEQWNELKHNKDNLYLTPEEINETNLKGCYVFQNGDCVPANKTIGKVWDYLGRGHNLKLYAQLVYAYTTSKEDTHKELLKLSFNLSPQEFAMLHAWFVTDFRLHVFAIGNAPLNNMKNRLIGIPSQNLESQL